MDSLPYLLFSYDLPLEDGVAAVRVCVNLIDARCVGVGISEKSAIQHMEHLWDELHENDTNQGFATCDDHEPDEEGRFGDF